MNGLKFGLTQAHINKIQEGYKDGAEFGEEAFTEVFDELKLQDPNLDINELWEVVKPHTHKASQYYMQFIEPLLYG